MLSDKVMKEERIRTLHGEGRPAGSPFDVNKAPELLAPAGSMEAFRGALCAGADAVYLAGEQYGARAYAANFTKEELLTALREAHLLGKRIYLTVNTLTRQSELPGLVEFVSGLVEEGNLDGVIVQDLGVLRALGKACPTLSLHASTQMSVTGAEAVRFLKEQGVCRVVPARELSLEEIRAMKEETGIELETFVHGAMCYCYSGKCLFSSLIGGRSGNRGRCAQPCRLPYRILDEQGKVMNVRNGKNAKKNSEKETYPLSMKDLCTLDILPELIEVGISSFKIEGRMKKPEYAAGVTAVYRKYIDRYMTAKREGRELTWTVEPKDRRLLQRLYLRTDLNTGYYHQKNGPDMVTMGKPGYLGAEEGLLKEIHQKYLERGLKIPLRGEVYLKAGEPARLQMEVAWNKSGKEFVFFQNGKRSLSAEVLGDEVQTAKSRPLEKEEVRKRLLKTGDTHFVFESLNITIDGEIFLPVASLNALRREGLHEIEEVLLRHNIQAMQQEQGVQLSEGTGSLICDSDFAQKANAYKQEKEQVLWAQIVDAQQWKTACRHPAVAGVIDDSGLFLGAFAEDESEEQNQKEQNQKEQNQERNQKERSAECERDKERLRASRPLYLLGLPYVYRDFHHKWMEKAWQQLREGIYDGVLVRTLEELQFLRERHYQGIMIADSGLYQWNKESRKVLLSCCTDGIFPLELNRRELQQVFGEDPKERTEKKGQGRGILTVYGRIPMMISANCIKKTAGRCDGTEGGFWTLSDRMGEKMPVRCFCGFCTNIIYNSVPLSLHTFRKDTFLKERRVLLCNFTTEKEREMQAVLDWYGSAAEESEDCKKAFPVSKYTTGHYKKGAL